MKLTLASIFASACAVFISTAPALAQSETPAKVTPKTSDRSAKMKPIPLLLVGIGVNLGSTVVDMKADWPRVFHFENK